MPYSITECRHCVAGYVESMGYVITEFTERLPSIKCPVLDILDDPDKFVPLRHALFDKENQDFHGVAKDTERYVDSVDDVFVRHQGQQFADVSSEHPYAVADGGNSL